MPSERARIARATGLALALALALAACRSSSDGATTSARDPGLADGTPVGASNVPAAVAPSSVGRASDAGSDGAPETYPVRWAPVVELRSLSEIDGLLDRPDPEGFGELEHEGQTRTPRTCRERSALVSQGYAPSNALEAQPDDHAMIRCGTLLLLKRARPSASSFVRDVRFDASALSVLPAALATALSGEETARVDEATRHGRSLGAYDARARAVKPSVGSELKIREGGGQSVLVVQPRAWGDVDGDGIEDVVVSVINAMTQGTYAGARLVVLTRPRPDVVLRSIEGPE
jgi:hypothetical protein